MKILRVVSDLFPHTLGGMAVHAHEMSKEQVRLGHDVTIMYASQRNKRSMHEFEHNYNTIQFEPIIKLMGNSITPNLFFKLNSIKDNFDIIHAHSYLYFSTNLAAISRRLGSPPLLITIHNMNTHTAPPWFEEIYIPTIGKWTLNSADKIICYTISEKVKLQNLGIESDKIAVIHNGIDTNKFIPKEKENSDRIRVLWIGRFVPGKGVEYLINAFNILVYDFPGSEFFMVGQGALKEKIKQKIRDFDLDKHVVIRDFIPNSKLVEIYQNSDVFVLSSLNEGVPRTILEAMACGIPIVCTELPQLVDVVKGCGLLVPVRDSEALADVISKVISDKELAQKLGETGRRRVAENYSWDDTVKKTIQLYEELI
ncbi:glycosyltransferase family 4 protein [candidate division WOR-3 bacterium]|nr:glycosyltransferase family 4 protein [candidate division WOR-3 bacterium]